MVRSAAAVHVIVGPPATVVGPKAVNAPGAWLSTVTVRWPVPMFPAASVELAVIVYEPSLRPFVSHELVLMGDAGDVEMTGVPSVALTAIATIPPTTVAVG
jgi:hypothetical protein